MPSPAGRSRRRQTTGCSRVLPPRTGPHLGCAALVGVVTHPEESGEKPLHASLEMARSGVLAEVFVGRYRCEECIDVALILIAGVQVVQNHHVDPVLRRSRLQSVALAI